MLGHPLPTHFSLGSSRVCQPDRDDPGDVPFRIGIVDVLNPAIGQTVQLDDGSTPPIRETLTFVLSKVDRAPRRSAPRDWLRHARRDRFRLRTLRFEIDTTASGPTGRRSLHALYL